MPLEVGSLPESLGDPAPPAPGATERAAVRERAHQLNRRRRALQSGSALVCAAIIGVGVVALVSSGDGSGSRTSKVETATAPTTTHATTLTTTPDAATPTVAPAPVEEPAQPEVVAPVAPVVEPVVPAEPPPAPEPVYANVTTTIDDVAPGVTLNAQLAGPNGTFTTSVDTGTGTAVLTFNGVPPGDYDGAWSWSSDDGAAGTGRFKVYVAPDGTYSVYR